MTNMLLLAGIACSIAMIAWLWHCDPKRRRVAGLQALASHSSARALIAVAALLPGAILIALGDSAALLVWLGTCAIGGWLVAQLRS